MGAVISECGLFRYRLDRDIGWPGEFPVGFCLHNPSKADARNDDPTSRRGIGFAKLWGATTLTYVNPWAGRATNPEDLWKMADPVGPDNDWHIEQVAKHLAANGGFMVAAWGAINPPKSLLAQAERRLLHVETIIRDCGCDLRCLGQTKYGHPKHPLYLKADTQPVAWPIPRAAA